MKSQTLPMQFRRTRKNNARKAKEPEPLIDVIEEGNEIVIFAEFAGFNTDNLRVEVKDQHATLSADGLSGRYYKSLNLPKRVIPETVRTQCKNGVLEVHLTKIVSEKTIDKMAR